MKQLSRRNSDKRRLVRLTIFVVGLLVAGWLFPRVIAWAGVMVVYPVQVTTNWLENSTQVIPALWRDKVALQTEVDQLQSELNNESDSGLSLERLRSENERLRALLGATTTSRTAAAVVATPRELPFDILQIDQGSRAGISVGAPVYRNADEVIGMVSTVYPRSALVTLFSTPGFTAAAYIDETNLLVTVEGLGGGVTRVQVPQGVPLQVGALVYLPTIQPGVIGRISAIENEPTQPQQFGYLVSDTAFRQLRYVSVGEPTDVRSDVSAIEKYVATIREAVAVPAALEVATTTATSSTSTVPTTSPETQ